MTPDTIIHLNTILLKLKQEIIPNPTTMGNGYNKGISKAIDIIQSKLNKLKSQNNEEN
jgi:hypothetical protein